MKEVRTRGRETVLLREATAFEVDYRARSTDFMIDLPDDARQIEVEVPQ